MNKICIYLVGFLLCASVAFAADDAKLYRQAIAQASRMSTLAMPGSSPFHLKLSVKELKQDRPEYNVEIEVWWASPQQWRHEVRSASFSQRAVRSGELYSESNSADYLPFWLHELIQESIDPIPLAELVRDRVELTKRGCAEWQEPYVKENQTAYAHHSVCFDRDGTVTQLFLPSMNVLLGNYQNFGNKRIARTISTWDGNAEIIGTVTDLEPLRPADSVFDPQGNTAFPARLRFVSAPESALELDTQHSAPLTWPIVHNFPASGVMTVEVKLDREGAVREIGTVVSTNFVLTGAAREQIQKWKFEPYLLDGAPVQVNTTLAIRYDAKMELLGETGKSLPVEPFLERMKKSLELSDPRTSDALPFHTQATIEGDSGQTGTYEEFWSSKDQWTREIRLGSVALQLVSHKGEQVSQKISGSNATPKQMTELMDLLVSGHFPDRRYEVYEADWGQSAVTFDGMDTVRVARGQVDVKNQPINGQAYWFDSSGLLRGDYEMPTTTTYADFAPWSNKQVPRRLEVSVSGIRKWLVVINKIEPLEDGAASREKTIIN